MADVQNTNILGDVCKKGLVWCILFDCLGTAAACAVETLAKMGHTKVRGGIRGKKEYTY